MNMTPHSNDLAVLIDGMAYFGATGNTPSPSYAAMRKLHPASNGRVTTWAADRMATPWEGARSNTGLFERLSADERQQMLSSLRDDGYAVAPYRMPEEQVDTLQRFAAETPTHYLQDASVGAWSSEKVQFEPKAPISNRYQFRLDQLVQNSAVLDLALDDSIHGLAGDAMGCEPILDLLLMWWSAPGHAHLESAAAQKYHFDLDRLRFLKLFVYLTDVTPRTGPHCYVRGSHQTLPPAINRDGRYSDQEIATAFGEEAASELCGPKGTMILADTRGFHKGKPCIEGHRLIFQMEYSCSLFGAPASPISADRLPAGIRAKVGEDPRRYAGVFSSP